MARRRIKISRFDDLNDPFELMAVELKDKAVRKAFQAVRDHMCANRGVICFSRGWHNPLLWSHYAEKHHGVCFGFELPDVNITSVLYDPKRLLAAATGHYFKDFGADMVLREVILGPRYSGSASPIAALARACGRRVSIIHSRLAFKSFRVVRDKSRVVV